MPAPRIMFLLSVRRECLRPILSVAGQFSHCAIPRPFIVCIICVLPKPTAKLTAWMPVDFHFPNLILVCNVTCVSAR